MSNRNSKRGSSNSPDADDESIEDILQEDDPGGEDVEDNADEVDDE